MLEKAIETDSENGECFRLLWMPYKYYVEQKNR